MNQGSVTLPKMPSTGMAILPWLKDCRRALQQLRDRVADTPKTPPAQRIKLPFAVSIAGTSPMSLRINAGAWQEGTTGEWERLAEFEDEGSFAYLVIEQDEDRAITDVSLAIEENAVDPVVEISGTPETATSYVLLAEVEDGVLIQRRHGNFTLGLWQIDGDVVRWPETVVGTIPPEEPPP